MNIVQTNTFKQHVKKLHIHEKKDLDDAIRLVVSDPSIGHMKKGDLNGVRVFKFKMVKQLTLLAYHFIDNKMQLMLLSFGPHENFYRDLSL
ncbi:MAG: type II toxin-antitoxin system RelE/ParE family toxin [Candidatus Dependentiae bacterium]|nr:type II toxin-antitoxin system RelE/ParE family toxin [Candidatus Dependentiae bacterium]